MNHPPTYICPRTQTKPSLTGFASDPAWQAAPWIESWTEIRGTETCPTSIKAKLMWDDEYLYLAAQMEEPHLWAFETEHDGDLWYDNVFELFLDPDGDGHNYFEWEINPLGVTLDLRMDKPYICGGTRDDSLEIPGLELALLTDGAVNDPSTQATGWEFAAAIPWSTLTQIGHPGTAPQPGDIHRFNLMKMFWPVEVRDGAYHKVESEPEKYWCLAPTHVFDIHRPWLWAYLQFAQSANETPYSDPDWETKLALCQTLGLTSRTRAQGPTPPEEIKLQPTQTLHQNSVQSSTIELSFEGLLRQN
ncbi:MAG: carbohydrate-binding family 9-like protein [Fimbriimonadaceae bacterium]